MNSELRPMASQPLEFFIMSMGFRVTHMIKCMELYIEMEVQFRDFGFSSVIHLESPHPTRLCFATSRIPRGTQSD